jgi:hypothetical protein
MIGKAHYEASIADYTQKRNLLRVEVDKDNHIKLFFDNTLSVSYQDVVKQYGGFLNKVPLCN